METKKRNIIFMGMLNWNNNCQRSKTLYKRAEGIFWRSGFISSFLFFGEDYSLTIYCGIAERFQIKNSFQEK